MTPGGGRNALLNHRVQGPGSRERALLLVHPLGADLTFWDECVGIWRSRIPCVACDLGSAGESPRAEGPATVAQHAAELEALRAALGFRTVVPIGCAVGSMVAASYAAGFASRVSSLVLANPALNTSPAARNMLSERARLVQESGIQAILPGAVDKAFHNQPLDERRARYHARFAQQDAANYVAAILGILDADVSADLPAIKCPTLVVAGGNDLLLPPQQARLVHGLLRDSQFVQFEDAAHFVPFQRPFEFAALVLDFLGLR